MRRPVLGALGLAAALSLAGDFALAGETRMDIGFLTCSLGGGGDTQAGSDVAPGGQTRDMLCTFKTARGGREETYIGTVQGVGEPLELFHRNVLMWAVRTTGSIELPPGVLQQTYAAEAAASTSQAPPLIGENNKTIILQSMAEKEGVVAAGDKRPQINAIVLAVVLKLRSAPA